LKGFSGNIDEMTLANSDFRKVLYTAPRSQIVLMSLKPKQSIGPEVHEESDRFFRFESGNGRVEVDGTLYNVELGSAILVPAGARHNVINTSSERPLKFFTIYAPPQHRDGVVRTTKTDAKRDSPEYDGQNSEQTAKSGAGEQPS
jgi:mannose-6-phosphate isomerase-like protein (cupin superfamily)